MQSLALLITASLLLSTACSKPISTDEPLPIEDVAGGTHPDGDFYLSTILRIEDEAVLACSERDLLESDPPECGSRQIPAILMFDVEEIPSLRTAADGVLLTGRVVLEGAFSGDTFVAIDWSPESAP